MLEYDYRVYVWEIDKLFKQIHFSKERLRPQKISRNFDAFNLFFPCFYFCFYKGGHWCQSLTRWVTLVKFKPLPNLLTLQLHLQYQDITSLTCNFLLIEKVNESTCEKIEKKVKVFTKKTSHNVVFPLKYVILTEFTWK